MTNPHKNKVYIIGTSNSGKSSLLRKEDIGKQKKRDIEHYKHSRFLSPYPRQYSTNTIKHNDDLLLGSTINSENLDLDKKQELEHYFPKAKAIIVTADLSKFIDKGSVQGTIDFIKSIAPDTKILLVGTKSDLDEYHNEEDVKELAENNNIEHVITSAKTKINITTLFDKVFQIDMASQNHTINTDDNLNQEPMTFDQLMDRYPAIQTLDRQLKKVAPDVRSIIENETTFMYRELHDLAARKEAMPDERYSNSVALALTQYQIKCHPYTSTNDILKKTIYSMIIATACAFVGIALAAGVCSAVGIAGLGATAIILAAGFSTSLITSAASRAYFFRPNPLNKTIENIVDEANSNATTPKSS